MRLESITCVTRLLEDLRGMVYLHVLTDASVNTGLADTGKWLVATHNVGQEFVEKMKVIMDDMRLFEAPMSVSIQLMKFHQMFNQLIVILVTILSKWQC